MCLRKIWAPWAAESTSRWCPYWPSALVKALMSWQFMSGAQQKRAVQKRFQQFQTQIDSIYSHEGQQGQTFMFEKEESGTFNSVRWSVAAAAAICVINFSFLMFKKSAEQNFFKKMNQSWSLCLTCCISPHRPQPPALPRQCRGGDPLPDGGRDNRHDVTEGDAHGPRSRALLPGDRRGAGHQPRPQPGHHRHFQRPAAVEILPQLQPAARCCVRTQGAVRAYFAVKRLSDFPPERFGLFVSLRSSQSSSFNTSSFTVQW